MDDNQVEKVNGPVLRKRTEIISRTELKAFFEESRRSREAMLSTVKDLTKSVNEVKTDLDNFKDGVKDLLTVFEALKGMSAVLIWFGKVAKPVILLSGMCAAAYAYFSGIKIPKITM